MATTYNPTRSARFPSAPFRTMFAQLNTWYEAHQTRQALSRLSLHELDDIGLT